MPHWPPEQIARPFCGVGHGVQREPHVSVSSSRTQALAQAW
jgi:hypothetical protein